MKRFWSICRQSAQRDLRHPKPLIRVTAVQGQVTKTDTEKVSPQGLIPSPPGQPECMKVMPLRYAIGSQVDCLVAS
ncbi:hypothetical protein Ari01nite_90800 [Paractinoplanes rishiriensis]|uniref:Uncharacterized protein n=1 Tax=Paractinoplanes rishiriensis TaxID=1050105 RepID=A0A919N1J4_9ACTN|nr:hypothetical protein Ari01nite_90800 [Actinoplanes rishiriensis]